MKKKLALLLMFLFSCITIFTGCNLFDTNNFAGLNSIVARSGNIEITREQLITAYNSSGYYYNEYYGYTMEAALKKTIGNLIDRQVLLDYIDKLEETDKRYELTELEKYNVCKETWDYVDSSIASIVKEVRKDLNLTVEDISTAEEEEAEPEFAPRSLYAEKFYYNSELEKVLKNAPENDDEHVPNKGKYDYTLKLSSKNKDYETRVWKKYITALKRSQSSLNYNDTSDSATFKREIDRIYKTNLENAKLKKFESLYTESFGLDYDVANEKYFINDATLGQIASHYKKVYNNNKQLYNMSYGSSNLNDVEINTFYNSLTNTTDREKFFYYGSPTNDETLISCLHILIKLSDEQLKLVEEAKSDVYIPDYLLEETLANIKSMKNTFAYERGEDGFVIDKENGISVETLFEMLQNAIRGISGDTSQAGYLGQITEIFNDFIYKYNVDPGILNAKFDYVVGTKTSAMVASFTEVVRKLHSENRDGAFSVTADYNDQIELYFPYGAGYAGAMSAPFLEESTNYSGYHIVLYTGMLKSVSADTLDQHNVYEKLSSQKTSLSYNQSVFELIFESLATEKYNNYQTQLVDSIRKSIKYDTSNFSDMYK